MEKILEGIWLTYLDSGFENISPLDVDDTAEYDKAIKDILDKTNISREDAVTLDNNICSISCFVEQLGFINGLKIGVKMARELGAIV